MTQLKHYRVPGYGVNFSAATLSLSAPVIADGVFEERFQYSGQVSLLKRTAALVSPPPLRWVSLLPLVSCPVLNFPGESRQPVIVCWSVCDEPVTCQLGSEQHKRINHLCAGFKSNGAESCSIFKIAFLFARFLFPSIRFRCLKHNSSLTNGPTEDLLRPSLET